MSQATTRARRELVDAVQQHATERLTEDSPPLFSTFVRQYYDQVGLDDLRARSVHQLYGIALSHLALGRQRTPGEPLVRLWCPDVEEHGFASPHTIVDIVTDDMPFLVSSVRMELARHGLGLHLSVHPVLAVRRDGDRLVEIAERDQPAEEKHLESWMHLEVDRQTDPEVLEQVRAGLLRVLGDVRAAVEDWSAMRQQALAVADRLGTDAAVVPADVREETAALLRWMAEDNFVFLGYREYLLEQVDGEDVLRAVAGTGLGLLRDERSPAVSHSFSELPAEVRRLARSPKLLNLTQANSRSTVHRPRYLDYVGVKRFDDTGAPIGERRFLGLQAAASLKTSPRVIPVLRRKVEAVLERAGHPLNSHDGRVLLEVLEGWPREELYQITEDELLDAASTVVAIQDRQQLRLLVRRDDFGRFLSCQVYLPRDRLNTALRTRITDLLMEAFDGLSSEYATTVGEQVLARLHITVRTRPGHVPDVDLAALEARLAAAMRSWSDDLYDALVDLLGEERGTALHRRYGEAFPVGYQQYSAAPATVADIERIESLRPDEDFSTHLYRPLEAPPGLLRLKLFRRGQPVTLSAILPVLEDMGVHVLDERPHQVRPAGAPPTWIYDIGLRYEQLTDVDDGDLRTRFSDAFSAVWRGELESDALNRLVLSAGVHGREVAVLRAYTRYLRQIGSTYGLDYTVGTLAQHPELARLLLELFRTRLDPARDDAARDDAGRDAAAAQVVARCTELLDGVESLNEDRVLRTLLQVVQATLRTNWFQGGPDGPAKPVVSLKLDSAEVPDLPLPRPMVEVFVYSPRVEGVHLRGGKVARGGLRWSDRPEDFRTEVLGLMKAQQVKNAVIVPVGAKGGFVVKDPPADRDALQAEVVECYSSFIRGLLDLTDNLVAGEVVAPDGVVRHDGDDAYLVVAADKGTATFSDIANGLAVERGFWLGDAFASGGSSGYDHKAMGITARGAWVSVQRHFRSLGVDVLTDDVTAVGIGDMSGDVFGNGMLLSQHVRLVAAFDHRHVFLDPDPDPTVSWGERRRLFELPRSSWADYDPALLSPGGGVFSRTAKQVRLSPQVKARLQLDADVLTPDALIRAVLTAPVDLLWNGGVGTYVKASSEAHADVGDKRNDAVRVDAADLRCRVVGEGGNLGFTQLARVELALRGGRINTDAIDNSAGVACSDREVNIKVLLDRVVDDGDLTRKQRNRLLVDMTDDVAALVLHENDTQTRALYAAGAQAPAMRDVHARYLSFLERRGRLNRAVEFLPTEEQLLERDGVGLTMPELAVVLAYTKIWVYDELLESDLPDDPFFAAELARYFPAAMRERFASRLPEHALRREIVATAVTNRMVDRAGTTFVFRLHEETGLDVPQIARAHACAWEVFGLAELEDEITALDGRVPTETQVRLLLEARTLAERASRWLLRSRRASLDVGAVVQHFRQGVGPLLEELPQLLASSDRLSAPVARNTDEGVPEPLAVRVAMLPALFAVLDITDVAHSSGCDTRDVAEVYFALGAELRLDWLRDRVLLLPRENRWQALARAALRDDLYAVRAALTEEVLQHTDRSASGVEQVRRWSSEVQPDVGRVLAVLDEVAAGGSTDLATLSVALREIRGLVQPGAR
ncbi:MAG: NAD-glutamate dehydrogenase [Actinomycetes bacterium]